MSLVEIVRSSSSAPQVSLRPALVRSDREFWPHASKQVLWGWKRDCPRQMQSRSVYFSCILDHNQFGVVADHMLFAYEHVTTHAVAKKLFRLWEEAREVLSKFGIKLTTSISHHQAGTIIQAVFGRASFSDIERLQKLAARHPSRSQDLTLRAIPHPQSSVERAISALPADIYIGAGLSYEAGIPTLREMHDHFCMHDPRSGEFAFGLADKLPALIASNPLQVIRNFCEVHIRALTARPPTSQQLLAKLHRHGLIRQILTDNVDGMLYKSDLPFQVTRGTGVTNETHPLSLQSNTLIVTGISADRRGIVAQARASGAQIIVVDPGNTPPNFITEEDIFYNQTAGEFFVKLNSELQTTQSALSLVG